MEILIRHKSSDPIYEQICKQIKEMVLTGELKPGDLITSVRALAKELGIGVLTVQKAYEKLLQEGVIETVIGKGTFITDKNIHALEDEKNQLLEAKAEELIQLAKKYQISEKELVQLIHLLYEDSVLEAERTAYESHP